MPIPTLPTFTAGQILTSSVMDDVSTLGNYQGLFHIKTQTIGTAVSSVTVTSAFSSDFDNYKIIVSGGVSSVSTSIQLRLGGSTTGYYGGLIFLTYSAAAANVAPVNNGANWAYAAVGAPSSLSANIELLNPFNAKTTSINAGYTENATTGSGGNFNGYHNSAVSYTAFTLVAGVGTMTGGTIRVYGYRNSL
jgi:hypothetical protein